MIARLRVCFCVRFLKGQHKTFCFDAFFFGVKRLFCFVVSNRKMNSIIYFTAILLYFQGKRFCHVDGGRRVGGKGGEGREDIQSVSDG